MKKIKNLQNKIKYSMYFLLLILVFIFSPVIFEKIIRCLQKLQNIKTSEANYFGFYGSILSGAFTLVGVIETIKYETRIKEKEDTIIYKPILVVDGINSEENCLLREVGINIPFSSSNSVENFDEQSNKFYDKLNEDNYKFRIMFMNKGRGETFNTILEKYEVIKTNWDNETNLNSCYSQNQYVGEIIKDGHLGIDINLPSYIFMPEKKADNITQFLLNTQLIITYSDIFDRIKYKNILHVNFKVMIDRYEKDQPYFYKEGFKFAKVHYEIKNIMPEKMIYLKELDKYVYEQEYLEEMKNKLL